MKVLVMDATHGGFSVAHEYEKRGAEVTLVDCYGTGTEMLEAEARKAGVHIVRKTPEGFFDLVVSPIHCPDHFLKGATWEKKITTHQAVGELCSFKSRIVEVTGTKGKTTTSHLIAHLLRSQGRRVLMLSSAGIVLYDDGQTKILKREASIAPTTILEVANMNVEFDVGVFEVSLGGTSNADTGVITTIENNYPIAAGTRKAYDGKVQMVQNSKNTLVIRKAEEGIWTSQARQGLKIVTFGAGGDVEVRIVSKLLLGSKTKVEILFGKDCRVTADLSSRFIAPAYVPSISAAAAVAFDFGLEVDDIGRSLSSFDGVQGRAEISCHKNSWIIRDRNPGVSAASIGYLLECMKSYSDLKKISLVVEPVSKRVCEKLDVSEIEKIISTQRDFIDGAYLLSDSNELNQARHTFEIIKSVDDVRKKSDAILWCTKEGFR
ncbi:MAG: coenzyme F430 synthase [Methanomassiliicoccales archaeon]